MLTTLNKYFGYTTFLPLQQDIIEDVLNKDDVLALMPTGGGKSLCYQLPALLLDGLTIVVSPLIALMKDQVDGLVSNGVPAAYINSSLTTAEIAETKNALVKGEVKVVYVAPERLMMPDFLGFIKRLPVNLIAIDEAHCISEWGHDFRPEYRRLRAVKTNFPGVPVIALTATATIQVQNDIVEQLNIERCKRYRASFNRANLHYRIEPKVNAYRQLLKYLKEHKRDSGIIYCQSRKMVDTLSSDLKKDGYRALGYHAGMTSESRSENQERFIRDDAEIIVATIAFGMGIDKPDVRYVIHYDLPKNIEGYYQETGRAGRDGLKSDCILFFSYGDKAKIEYFIRQKDDPKERDAAYRMLRDMVGYCETNACRRTRLLAYFDEEFTEPNCGACDICLESRETYDGTAFDHDLFEILRDTRKTIADDEGLPPYVIFHDATLKEMATFYPVSPEQLADISGVGEVKLKKYGERFLSGITGYCAANGIEAKEIALPRAEPPAPKAPKLSGVESSTVQMTFQLYNQGLSLEKMVEQRSLSPQTIITHLEKLIHAGEEVSIDRFVPTAKQQAITAAILDSGPEILRSIKDRLGPDFSYEEIRLVRAKVVRQQKGRQTV
ncbi:MAG: RecQ family ATP-dependent DNA helicase [Actinobacteria bacterium]|nr:RecQ family ATP-dependent DNA helicase [Actinomycetota bacterium]